MNSSVDILDSREDQQNTLDRFARSDNARPRNEVTIPPQAFAMSGDQIIGAQKVAVYRDEGHVLAKLKTLAAAAGTDWFYRFPVKNKGETNWIEGASIKLANDLARVYGNCSVDVRVMDIGDSWLFYARFVDFETGFSLTRPFQQRKDASKLGGKDDGRRLDIALQIGASKAIRNVVVNALQTFSDFAFEEARGALVDKIGAKLEHYRTKVVERLGAMQIDVKRVEIIRGRTVADWLAPDIARTIAEIQAVQDGMAMAEETWPSPTAEEKAAAEKPAKKKAAPLDDFAAGKAPPAPDEPAPSTDAAEPTAAATVSTSAEGDTAQLDMIGGELPALAQTAMEKARQGRKAFDVWLKELSEADYDAVKPHLDAAMKELKAGA